MKQSSAIRLAKQGRLSEDFRCSIRRMVKDWNKILEMDAENKFELKLKQLEAKEKPHKIMAENIT